MPLSPIRSGFAEKVPVGLGYISGKELSIGLSSGLVKSSW